MRFSFCLAAVKDQRNKKKKKKEEVGGRRSIVKADSRSAITCRDIPEEILVEILVRLPANSLMRFKCVSKSWSSLISSRYFTNLLFKFSSSKRERRVFVYTNDYTLHSSLLINVDATASFLHLTLPGMKKEDGLHFSNAVRGLICFSGKAGIRIINLATRQVLSLPHPRCNIFVVEIIKWNYLGYDPVNDEYKVLNVFSYFSEFLHQVSNGKHARSVRSETQVLVLGAGTSWRNTKSTTSPPPPHCPSGQGINIKGVLYYDAWYYHEERRVLMSFDLNSEEFNLIKFPMEVHYKRSLMNYQDQVTVIDDYRLTTEYTLDLWVLEDAGKNKWSHKFFVLPYHELRLGINIKDLKISGTSRRGEILLSKWFGNRKNKKNTLAVYDVEKSRIMRRFVIEPPCPVIWHFHLWDVENIIYLEA